MKVFYLCISFNITYVFGIQKKVHAHKIPVTKRQHIMKEMNMISENDDEEIQKVNYYFIFSRSSVIGSSISINKIALKMANFAFLVYEKTFSLNGDASRLTTTSFIHANDSVVKTSPVERLSSVRTCLETDCKIK